MESMVWDEATVRAYTSAGYWGEESLGDRLNWLASADPSGVAFIEGDDLQVTWTDYRETAARLACLIANRFESPVAVLMRDSWLLHAVYMAAEYAGLVAIGIGPRAGDREIAHILKAAKSARIITCDLHRGRDMSEFVESLATQGVSLVEHIVIRGDAPGNLTVEVNGHERRLPSLGVTESSPARRLGPNDLFFINSTSGTTGLPKCVMHTQNRWQYFHKQCIQFAKSDIFLVVVPNPFGFGLWMSHVTPLMLGAPTVLLDEFTVERTIELIENHRVSVLAAVTTQALMMLSSPALTIHDVSSLRVIQTGGERVPLERSAELERLTGAHVLQFYGSNESGCLSRTEIDQPIRQRLGTAGRVIPEMNIRIFDDDGMDITSTGGPGRCACKGPAMSPGYFQNTEGNAELFRPDGWMYLGDIVTIDPEGFLTVEGRVSDFIIRGGQNISAGAVEEEVLSHPRVREAAVVGTPDEIYGERVCAFVVTFDSADLLLHDLVVHLAGRGVSKNMWPEHIVNLSSLPRTSGGKIAKKQLRDFLIDFDPATDVAETADGQRTATGQDDEGAGQLPVSRRTVIHTWRERE